MSNQRVILDGFLMPLRPTTYPGEDDVRDMIHPRSGLPPLDAPRPTLVRGSAAQGLDKIRRTKSYAAKVYRRTAARSSKPVRMRRNPDDGSLQLVWPTSRGHAAAAPPATIAQNGPSLPVASKTPSPEPQTPRPAAPGAVGRFAALPNISQWRSEPHGHLRTKVQAEEYDQ